ncbi:MAG: hypothetical protein RLY93_03930 [Sumerlaeia bacterium]
MSNGFWRPSNYLLFHLLARFAGLEPLAYHLTALALHAVVCAQTGLLARRMIGGGSRIAWLASLMMATHFAAFPVALILSNAGDSILAIGLLGALLMAERWRNDRSPKSLTGLYAFALLAFTGKETAVVVPVVLGLWLVLRGEWRGPLRRHVLLLTAGAALLGSLSLHWMSQRPSYLLDSRVAATEASIAVTALDYLAGAFWPWSAEFLAWPLTPFPVAEPGLARWLAALGLAGAGLSFARRRSVVGFAALSILLVVLPVSVLGSELAPRYLYAALPFVCLAWLAGLRHFGPGRFLGRALRILAVGVWGTFLAAFVWSPTPRIHREIADDMEAFAAAVHREAPAWSSGDRVLILDLPHPGDPANQWVYSQLLLNVLLPETPVTLTVNPADAAADWRYRWENGALVAWEPADGERASRPLLGL